MSDDTSGGRANESPDTGSDDIVAVITAQHRVIESLLEQASAEDADRIGLLQQVGDLLGPHSEAEEDFVYPAIRDYDPAEGGEVQDGAAEHHHIESVLGELLEQDPDSPGYDGKLAGLVGELRHHIEEEESDLLPVLTARASAEERAELGIRFAEVTGWLEEGAAAPAASAADEGSRQELYQQAKEMGVPGRSKMTKEELAEAVQER